MLKKEENAPETGTKRKTGGAENQCLPKKMKKNDFFFRLPKKLPKKISLWLSQFAEYPSIL